MMDYQLGEDPPPAPLNKGGEEKPNISSRAKLFVYNFDSHCRVRALRAALRVRNAPQPINTSDRIERISN